ncbi:MAG: mechanosensitive ion channel family protein [Clostridia bacterium]|nr:mechanosensitive ion channel family protein [Clostridia bacterium]
MRLKLWDFIKWLFGFPIFNTNLLRILLSLAAMVLFLRLRQGFARLLMRLLNRLEGENRLGFGCRIIRLLEPAAQCLFVIIGLSVSTPVLGLSGGAKIFINHTMRSGVAFLLFWTLYRCSGIASDFFQRFLKKSDDSLDSMLVLLFNNGFKLVVIIFGATVILQEWGYNVAGLIAGLGLSGLALALAAKDTAANLFGSIMIMIDRPFVLGDWIRTPHAEGIVEEVGFRSTRVRTFEQALVTLPNSLMSNHPITNWSRMGKRRVSFKLQFNNSVVIDQVKECIKHLRSMLETHPEVHPETVLVYFEKFSSDKLEILLYFYTKTTDWQEHLGVKEEINFEIVEILQQMGIFSSVSAVECT